MQLLDARSLLLLARCSRRLQQDATGALAWKGKPFFALKFGFGRLSLSTLVVPPLLRLHQPFSIVIDRSVSSLSDGEFGALLSIPHVASLHIGYSSSLSFLLWGRLASSPWTAGLSSLGVTLDDLPLSTPLLTALLTNCPQLEELGVNTAAINGALATATLSPHLRALAVCDYLSDDGASSVTHTIQQHMQQLTRLTIVEPQLYGARFREFFTHPNLAQLESLSLLQFFPASAAARPAVSAEDYAAAFRRLPHLHHLSLSVFNKGACVLVSQLPHCPSLRTVDLAAGVEQLPSPFALARLLVEMPNLHMQVRTAGNDAGQREEYLQLQQWKHMNIDQRFRIG